MKTVMCCGKSGRIEGGAVNAAKGEKAPTVAELVAAANALYEKSKDGLLEAELRAEMARREVVGLVLTPRNPDGSGGQVEKVIRIGGKPERRFAEPVAYFAESADAGKPVSEDELTKLTAEAKELQAIVDDPATGTIDRQRASMRLTAVRVRIAAIETALHPEGRVGEAPTAAHRWSWAVPAGNDPSAAALLRR